ncbi:Peptidase A1 domain-containing protein [Aphelenchoides fujianensis]|nr:Peptidase A1 domain-containing protein [Aphelenchoides fujianensis]
MVRSSGRPTSFLVVEQLDCAVDPPVNPYVPTLPPVDKRQFDPNESSTLSQYGDYCSLDPWGGGDGSNRFDVVQLNDLVVQQGAFCLLDVTSYELHHALYDGILGLGFQDGDEDYAIMKQLVEAVRPPAVHHLARRNRPAGSAGGLLSFGDLDADHCDSDWTFVPLSPVDWDVDYGPQWKVNMTTVEIGRYTVDIDRQATVFSGDSYLTAAATDFHAIMAELGAQFDYRVDEFVLECSRRDQLPDLVLTIGGREFSISAYEYLFESDAGDGLCNVAITGSIEDENPNTWSLGEPFMRAHCMALRWGLLLLLVVLSTLLNRSTQKLIANRAAASGVFTIPLDAPEESFYTINITLGTPPQTFVVQPDTSISSFWVVDKSCTSDYCTDEFYGYTKHRYDRNQSTTAQADGREFVVEFASGSYAKDTLGFGNVKVEGQIFGAASSIEEVLISPFDGYLGLGWSVDDSIPSVLQGLTEQLQNPILTFALKP